MELKHCPFCGGEAKIMHQPGPYYMWSTYVKCKGCHATSSMSCYGNNGTIVAEECSYEGKGEAIKRVSDLWNMRVKL